MSIFPTKILLATDGSEEAALAATTAADLAQKTGSELHIVNVRLAPVYIEPTSEVAHWISSIEESERKQAQQLLDAQAEQIQALGATVAQTHVRLGRPDEEIVILAEEIGAGLIAMGSRGLGGMRRVLMGSISDSVVRHAHCPVLVTRAGKDSPTTSNARSQPLAGLATKEQSKSYPSGICSRAPTARSGRRMPPLTGPLFGGCKRAPGLVSYSSTLTLW